MILTGTSILLASGKTKPAEKLRVGDVLRSHTGGETRLREVIPLRSKKNILIVCGKHFAVVHHDQPFLTTYGWMRARMLRAGDNVVTFHESGGGSAPLLWTDSQRDWDGRLAKVDFRTLNVPPWPSPAIGKVARRALVSRAHVRQILPDAYRTWAPLVRKWDRIVSTENRAANAWRSARDAAAQAGELFTAPTPERTTIEAFLAKEGLNYSPAYFSNWCSKVRHEETGNSQPGFDLICDGGFVMVVGGSTPPIHLICRDAAKYDRPARSQEDDEDEDLDEEDDSETEPSAAAPKARSAPSAFKMPPPSRTAKPPSTLSLR